MFFKKYTPILFGLIVALIGIFVATEKVNAVILNEVRVPNVFYERISPTRPYSTAQFREWSIDGRVVYCIEPGVNITTNLYIQHSGLMQSPFSPEENQLMQLIGHYGYDYPGHQTLRFRIATQQLIWEAVSDFTFPFNTQLFGAGTPINVNYERNRIMNLVNNHYTRPSFHNTTRIVNVNDSITITDANMVLNNYTVVNSPDAVTSINGNSITITPSKVGMIRIELARLSYDNEQTFVYTGSDDISQIMAFFRVTEPVTAFININVTGASITINKTGEQVVIENGSFRYEEILLPNVIYGLFNLESELIATITTDANGQAILENIPLGKYYLQEISSSLGNMVDDTKHYFELDSDMVFNFHNRLPKGTLEFKKTDSETKAGIPNTLIGIYTENNELIFKGYTNEFGKIILENLFLGRFQIKEKRANIGYHLTDEVVYFEITGNGEKVRAFMDNERIANVERINVPDTGIDMFDITSIIGIISLLGGMGFLLYENKKE